MDGFSYRTVCSSGLSAPKVCLTDLTKLFPKEFVSWVSPNFVLRSLSLDSLSLDSLSLDSLSLDSLSFDSLSLDSLSRDTLSHDTLSHDTLSHDTLSQQSFRGGVMEILSSIQITKSGQQ